MNGPNRGQNTTIFMLIAQIINVQVYAFCHHFQMDVLVLQLQVMVAWMQHHPENAKAAVAHQLIGHLIGMFSVSCVLLLDWVIDHEQPGVCSA